MLGAFLLSLFTGAANAAGNRAGAGSGDVSELEQQIGSLMEGDPAAVHILAGFGEACAGYAAGGMARLDMLQDEVTVYLSGGIFKFRSSILKDTVTAGILKANQWAKVKDAMYEPVVGAALIGLETYAGGAPAADAAKQLHESAKAAGFIRQSGN